MSIKPTFVIPTLDGIRAVAVLMVFFSHAGYPQIPGGLGVSIFFFLSGYLITTLLRREYEQYHTVSFRNFFLRRALRILPPMYLVLFLVLLATSLTEPGGHVTVGGLLAQVLQFTNYFMLIEHGNGIVPYTNTFWSLAVEEHFYLVFPLLFLSLVRRWTYPRVVGVLLALCVLALVWRCVLVFGFDASAARIFYATDTRLDSLLFGCIMGLWLNPALDRMPALLDSTRYRLPILLASLAVLLLLLVYRPEGFRNTVRYTLQGLALMPLFWLAIRHPQWGPFRLLNMAWVRRMGVLSYVVYLCHFYLLHVAAMLMPQSHLLAMTTALIASILFAQLVYHVVEMPCARLRQRLHGRSAPPRPVGSDINAGPASTAPLGSAE